MDLNDLCNLDVFCLICLTGSEKNICLDNKLNEKRKDSPSILKAVERVTSVEIRLDENYPSVICPTCLNSISISYELIEQFENTQKLLTEYFPKINEKKVPIESIKNLENQFDLSNDPAGIKNSNSIANINQYIEAECSDENLILSKIHYCCNSCQKVYTTIKSLKKHEEKCVKLKCLSSENAKRIKINRQESKCQNIADSDEESFESVLLLKYSCDRCSKMYTSEDKLKEHQVICTRRVYNKEYSIQDKAQISLGILKAETNKSQPKLIEEINLDSLSETEKDIFQSALKLQHKCLYCHNFFSSIIRCNKHLQICKKRRKVLDLKLKSKTK